ncbi:MAG TPA: nicotinate-nucleotide adenylyltransferase [Candidatus Omnitrophota bacterium]|nr:nicotinate-nucleotide adenylyltransferase [Candidatus Omnitrophota bacterium]HQO57093.1 nicotinate-nucleotide adenylyltransferase [Candidatus Omnitrophota bacterium]HQP12806.1 nicotinate-nucleotide adenylyltransferase [Candidatus Omnitrophota bacterium]
MKTERIGILGGTFDPVHIGHMAIAQKALEKCRLDKVIFVPSALPPHKKMPRLASAWDRYRMVALAAQGNPRFEVSDYEVQKGGKSYSIDTVCHFRAQYPAETKLFFIIGEDNVDTLETWKEIDRIIEIVTFIVVNRPGFRHHQKKIKFQSVMLPGMDISSSYLRRAIAQGKTIKYLVPDKVLEYIEHNQLYKFDK